MHTPTEAEVLAAADGIIDAFAATDTEAYFAGFSPDATFIFHPEARDSTRARSTSSSGHHGSPRTGE